MKRIIVVAMPERKGVYLLTVAEGAHAQAGFGSVPESHTAQDLPGALVKLGVTHEIANHAALEVDKNGQWISDVG
jgi:hypothetical protein